MKKISGKPAAKKRHVDDDLAPEYRVDYLKARPNCFAGKVVRLVSLDPDVAEVFTTSDAVNAVLRALIATMPKADVRKSNN